MLRRLLTSLESFVKTKGSTPESGTGEKPAPAYAGVGLLCAAGALAGYLSVPDAQAHAAGQVSTRLLGREVGSEVQPAHAALGFARAYLRVPIKVSVGPW